MSGHEPAYYHLVVDIDLCLVPSLKNICYLAIKSSTAVNEVVVRQVKKIYVFMKGSMCFWGVGQVLMGRWGGSIRAGHLLASCHNRVVEKDVKVKVVFCQRAQFLVVNLTLDTWLFILPKPSLSLLQFGIES
jgi:hypothetical protein